MNKDIFIRINRETTMLMILLISLTSSVCEVFEPAQTSQQTEGMDVSFHWDTETETDMSLTNVDCWLPSDPPKVLYHMINGVECPESQHEQFAGRVQLDRDALRTGQIELTLFRVTAEDSGHYQCELAFNYDTNRRGWSVSGTKTFVLSVSDEDKADVTTPKSGPEAVKASEHRRENPLRDYVFLAFFILSLLVTAVMAYALILCRDPRQNGAQSLIDQPRNAVTLDIPDS